MKPTPPTPNHYVKGQRVTPSSVSDSILSVPPPVVNVSKEDLMKLAYMPSRDDYEFEYDNEAENVLCQLDDDLAAGGDEHNKRWCCCWRCC